MDVIFKEGMLYLQGFKFGKRTWRKIWMVLFKPSSTGVGRLEFFNVLDTSAVADQKKLGRQKTSERKVVRLSDCLSVTLAPKESCPQGHAAFYLNTTQCTYTLASTTCQDWISAICLLAFQKAHEGSDKGVLERGNALTMEDNALYSSWKSDVTLPANHYQVTVQSTEASRRCKLSGEYLVFLKKEAVSLLAVSTGHTIYHWPYKLLRKFGLVEGGFSIEAGRRCESGEGVFIFLSTHGPLIFQGILDQCSLEKKSSVQPLNVNRRSLCDQSLPTTSIQAAVPTAYNPAEVSADIEEMHYSTINEASGLDVTQLSTVKPDFSDSEEALRAQSEDEDECCHSLEALKLNDDNEETIYYNLRRGTVPLIREDQYKYETDDSECIYADVSLHSCPSNPQLQPPPPLLPSPAPQQSSLAISQSVSPPRPRNQRQPPVNNYTQPGYYAQAQAVDDMQEMEEAISSSASVGPTEPPGTFKHRLAEIISKDLAKVQLPLPSGAGSPAFSQ